MRPDQVSLGVLVNAVPRDAVDEAVAVCGVREKRSDGKLPAHVITYLTLALCLFPDDDYTRSRPRSPGRWTGGAAGTRPGRCRPPVGDHPGPQTAGPAGVRRSCSNGLRPGRRQAGPTAAVAALGTARGVVPAPVAAAGDRRVRGRRARQQGERRRVRLRRVAGTTGRRSPRPGWWRWPSAAPTRSSPPRSTPTRSGRRPWRSGCIRGCAPTSCSPRTAASTPGQAWDTAAATGAALLWRAPTQLELPVVRVLRRRHLPHRADQPDDPRCPPGAAAGRRPRRAGPDRHQRRPRRVRRARAAGHPPGPGRSSTTCPTGSATAPAS